MPKPLKGNINRRRKQRGSAFVEFALASTLLVPLLFGVMDFGRLFYASIEVANAAAAGANYGSRNAGNMTDATGISTAAKNDSPDLPSMTVASSKVCQDNSGASVDCSSSSAYQYVSVTASYTFQTTFNYPLIPSSVPLNKTVMMRGK